MASPEEVTDAVISWQEHLVAGLAEQGIEIAEWPEGQTLDYATDRPGWEGLFALVLKAYSLYHPEVQIPDTIPSTDIIFEEPTFVASQSYEEPTCILSKVELWLPGTFESMFEIETVTGHELLVTSLGQLLALLESICVKWNLNADDVAKMETDQPGSGSPLEEGAMHGLAVFLRIARKAQEAKAPLILDY